MSTATPSLRDEAARLRCEADLLERVDGYEPSQCVPVGAALIEAALRLRVLADRLYDRGSAAAGETSRPPEQQPEGDPACQDCGQTDRAKCCVNQAP